MIWYLIIGLLVLPFYSYILGRTTMSGMLDAIEEKLQYKQKEHTHAKTKKNAQ